MTASYPETRCDRLTLTIDDLSVVFPSPTGPFRALEHVTFGVGTGQGVAVIGQSGSGKSTLARACLGLLSRSATVSGRVLFEGHDLLRTPWRRLRGLLGPRIGFVGQDSYAAFDAFFPIGMQLSEILRTHSDRRRESSRLVSAVHRVGLDSSVLRKHPHEMSGGMLQRAQVAAALLLGPSLLVADEPTSALDPVRRHELVALLAQVRHETNLTLLLVTHDLAVAAALADQVVVLHEGRVVETGPADEVLTSPRHPQTGRLVEMERRCSLRHAIGVHS